MFYKIIILILVLLSCLLFAAPKSSFRYFTKKFLNLKNSVNKNYPGFSNILYSGFPSQINDPKNSLSERKNLKLNKSNNLPNSQNTQKFFFTEYSKICVLKKKKITKHKSSVFLWLNKSSLNSFFKQVRIKRNLKIL